MHLLQSRKNLNEKLFERIPHRTECDNQHIDHGRFDELLDFLVKLQRISDEAIDVKEYIYQLI
jgi:hypothetical protein